MTDERTPKPEPSPTDISRRRFLQGAGILVFAGIVVRLAPQVIQGQVDHDPVEPRRKLGLALEAGERLVGPDEGFLGDVQRVFPLADQAVGYGEGAILMAAYQVPERLLATALRPLNQRAVIVPFLWRNHAPRTVRRWPGPNIRGRMLPPPPQPGKAFPMARIPRQPRKS